MTDSTMTLTSVEIPPVCLEFDDAGFCTRANLAKFSLPSIDAMMEAAAKELQGRRADFVSDFAVDAIRRVAQMQAPDDHPATPPWSFTRYLLARQFGRIGLDAEKKLKQLSEKELAS